MLLFKNIFQPQLFKKEKMVRTVQHENPHVLVFQFDGDIEEDEFNSIVKESVEKQVEEYGEINLVYILNTPLSNFTTGVWVQDALLGLQNLSKWNKCAIVTDKQAIQSFTEFFSKIMPGQFRGFDMEQSTEAIEWVAQKSDS